MLIIIEGPDGSGKSTLIESLRANSSAPWFLLFRTSGPPQDIYQIHRYMALIRKAAQEDLVICDRVPAISEAVYGPLYGRTIPMTYQESRAMVAGAKLVYCRPPWKVLQQSVQKEAQMEGVPSRLGQIVSGYDHCIKSLLPSLGDLMMYDYTATSLDSVRGFINLGGPKCPDPLTPPVSPSAPERTPSTVRYSPPKSGEPWKPVKL